MSDYWSNRVVFGRVAGLELASLTFEILADFTKRLPSAFNLMITARGLGVFLGRTMVHPIADGPLKLSLKAPTGQVFGDLVGSIELWRGIDTRGGTLAQQAGADWPNASAVAFTVVGKENLTVPTSAIADLVPHLGWIVAAALTAFGSKITLNIGHDPIVLPIHRDAKGDPLPGPV